jgi:acyl-coenzyme A synthetase/AMP-(fatty) acid ligase
MNTQSLYDAVRGGAARREAPALLAEGRTWTYGFLLDAAAELAAQLTRRPDPEEPVVAEVSDPVAAAVTTIGCDLAGIPVIHKDPASPDRMAGWVLHDSRASTPGPDEIPCLGGRMWLRAGGRSELPADLPAGSQVFLTSGSTGTPTAVVRTADAVLADGNRVAAFLGYAPDAPVVAAAPLFHVYGFAYGLVGPLLTGAPVHWCPPRSVPSQLARAVKDSGARTLIALPAHYGLIAGVPGLADPAWDAMFGTVRSAVSAGARLAPGVAATVAGRFAFGLHNCYGSSEAGAVTLTRVTGQEGDDWIGPPLPGVMARIERLDDSSDVGELLLRTSSLAAERLGSRGREPLARPDGWYSTGDLALMGPPSEGIRLAGRASSVINVAGEKVSPGEVERVLAAHPQVVDVQVIGAPDPVREQVPVARVVVADAAVLPQLIVWCRDRLAPHQVPRRFDLVDHIPRSATGKPLAGAVPTDPAATPEAQ